MSINKKHWRLALIVMIVGLLAFGAMAYAGAGYNPDDCEGPKVDPVIAATVPQYFPNGNTQQDPLASELPKPDYCVELQYFKINLDQNQIENGKTYKIGDNDDEDVSSSDPDSEFEVTIYKSAGNVYFAFEVESNHSVMHAYAKGGNQGGNLYMYYDTFPYGVTEDCNLQQSPNRNQDTASGWSHITFFYCEVPPVTICAEKLDDYDDAQLADWTFDLFKKVDGVWVDQLDPKTTAFDADGNYVKACWFNLNPGEYKVVERPQDGWIAVDPVSGELETGYLAPGTSRNLTFINRLIPPDGETAWAYLAGKATPWSDNASPWGWYNGPFLEQDEPYVLSLYAGAAQNDISKGTLVGYVYLDYADEEVRISMLDGFYLEKVHAYIGNTEPTDHSPGHLGYNSGVLAGDTTYHHIPFSAFSCVDFGEAIYLAVHADVIGYFED